MALRKGAPPVPVAQHTSYEMQAMVAYELVKNGHPFNSWTRWTLDQMALYCEGRRLRRQFVEDEVALALERARQAKKDTLLRYVISVE